MKTAMEPKKLRKVLVRSGAREVILWVRLWLSLLVGVFILAIVLSGAALVFRDETRTAQVALSAPYDPRAKYGGVDGDVSVWIDPYADEIVLERDSRGMSGAAKIFEVWPFLLRVSSFGGPLAQVLWALVGMAPLVLTITGLTTWLLKPVARRQATA